jgi:phage-related tail fiber protein
VAYVKTVWSTGDVITATLANHLETQYDEVKTEVEKIDGTSAIQPDWSNVKNKAHASSHASAGSDPIAPSDIGAFNSISSGSTSDPNTTQESYILTNHANSPGLGLYWHIKTYFYSSKTGNRSQIAQNYNGSGEFLYIRHFYTSWSAWEPLIKESDVSEASTASSIARRNSSGDINARLFRSEYDTTNSSIGFIMTQVDTATNNYIRPSTPAQVKAALGGTQVVNGSYTGDGNTAGRLIDVGFTPKLVIVRGPVSTSEGQWTTVRNTDSILVYSSSTIQKRAELHLATNGFEVGDGNVSVGANENGSIYDYVAIS